MSPTPQFALDERSLFENDNAQSLAEKIDYWYENDEERLKMGAIYAESAKQYSLENSILSAERMFKDEINDFGSATRTASVLVGTTSPQKKAE